MDPKEIRELIELISRSEFSEFELEGKGFKLRLVKRAAPVPAAAAANAPGPSHEPATPSAVPAPSGSPAPAPSPPLEEGLVELKSPIVGTFYRSPSPDADPFVEVGTQVKRGQVMCIVEAMKVMNEIEAEIDAEVVEVAVANGQPVEYGEVLFRLRPLG